MSRQFLLVGLILLLGLCSPAFASYELVADSPELTIFRNGANESLAMPGESYTDFACGSDSASFTIQGVQLGSGSKRVMGHGISRVSWQPAGESTAVTVTFSSEPSSSFINAIPGSETHPGMPQVVAGFYFSGEGADNQAYPVLGSRKPGSHETGPDPHGSYELPRLPEAKYSDALVNLDVRNVDFRDVLWLMSEIGNVSIMLDPYWADEPTGSRRPVGGGADPGASGGGDDGSGGFRNGGNFVPAAPREGTGNLTLSFKDVPFDLALDLIIMSVGLVKVDIYPGDLR